MSISAIHNHGCPHQPAPSQQLQSSSFDQLYRQSKNAEISVITDEGDLVTFSQNYEFSASSALQQWDSPLGRGMNFTAESLQSESISFSVQGDLNEEELADLAALYDDLAAIANDFYAGDMAGAMNGAMTIGDMGSLASLSATFSHSEMSASRLVSNHVIPAEADKLQQGFKDLPPLAAPEQTSKASYQEIMQSRWQQLLEHLENRPEPEEKADQLPPDKKGAGRADEQMLARLQETATDHPRLSPLSIPLAHRAIDEGGKDLNPIERIHRRDGLKQGLLNRFEQWLRA